MENCTVAVVKCKKYEEAGAGIKKALDLIGGIEKYVKPGYRVVIKPNLVSRKKPEEAATTNPAFVRAVAEMVEAAGGTAVIAESPGGPYSAAYLKNVYSGCGIDEAVRGTGAQLNYKTDFSELKYPDGEVIKSFPIIQPVIDADLIISLPKLKTHAMTSYTGAVKNLFGVIPGTHKAELHFRLDDREAFCNMLVDLYECVSRIPVLSIMDGIVGMEGNGPTAGQNRFIGLILASENAHALDLAACRIIDYTPEEVATVKYAVRRGLIPENAEGLNILGEPLNELVIKDFIKPESHFNLLRLLSLPESVNKFMVSVLSSKPKIDYKKCAGCGECARCCPPKAMDMAKGKPVIDEKKCIKCFCCQELCPHKAVKIHRSAINKLMLKILK